MGGLTWTYVILCGKIGITRRRIDLGHPRQRFYTIFPKSTTSFLFNHRHFSRTSPNGGKPLGRLSSTAPGSSKLVDFWYRSMDV